MKEKLISESRRIAQEAKNKSIGYIMAGLGVVVGLAWNEVIKALIEIIYPASSGGALLSKLIYAVVITVVIVVVSLYLIKGEKK